MSPREKIAEFILRAAFGLFFLFAGIAHALNFDGTIDGASIIWADNDNIRKILAAGAVLTLILGGGSLLLGYKSRIGAALLCVFLLPATYLHMVVMQIASNSASTLNLSSTEQAGQVLQSLLNIAVQGHQSNVIKNIMLLLVCGYFVVIGARSYSFDSRRSQK